MVLIKKRSYEDITGLHKIYNKHYIGILLSISSVIVLLITMVTTTVWIWVPLQNKYQLEMNGNPFLSSGEIS